MNFFLDANLPRHLAAVLTAYDVQQRHAVEHLYEHFKPSTPDVDWLSALAERPEKPFVITRDKNQNTQMAEVQTIANGGLSVFFLRGKMWANADVHTLTWRLVKLWPAIAAEASKVWGMEPCIFFVIDEKITRDPVRNRRR